jgi:RNA polymerase sigma-70 factor (ECF subfamily)
MIPSPLSEDELQKLVLRAKDGDTEAFATIYDHFFGPVYRYAAFRLPREVAEDTTADIFVKAWEKLHTYKSQHKVPFGAWLFRIARHTVIDVYRSHRGFDEVPESLPDTDSYNRTEARIERQDTLRIVRQALNQLPRRYREVLLLTYVSELPYQEVARVLHMTEGGVRVLKLRALRKLEALLPPDMAI